MLLISACGHVETKSFTYSLTGYAPLKADLGLRYLDGLLWKLHMKYSDPELKFGMNRHIVEIQWNIRLMSSDGFKLIEIPVDNDLVGIGDCGGIVSNSLECQGKVENDSRETFSSIEQFKIISGFAE